MWCRGRRGFIEELAGFGSLVFGPFANGRPTTDFSILVFDLGRAAFGDEFGEVGLEGTKRDEVTVGLGG
jgi:hypothetical protein